LHGSFDVEVAADATVTTTYHSEIEVKNESVIAEAGQRPFFFNSSIEKLDIVEAYDRKPDGRKLPVDTSAIFEQLAPGSPNVPIYSDQKQKVVVFPDVEVGDVLSTTVKYLSQPLLPGLFTLYRGFDHTYARNDVHVHLIVPSSMSLLTETHELHFSKHHEGDRTVYDWTFANPRPLAEENLVLDATDRVPRIFASSFASYEQLARAYAVAADAKTTVTPAIQKLADEITNGVADRRQQAEKIYSWVSRRIRYVAIELGRGTLIPHDAGEVLAAGYGDCKDHSALLVALLKAKGITANIVLVNYGNGYSLPSPPTFAGLNHAITYLPEFDMFVDSTAGVAPFGMLPFGEYGKSVVVAAATGEPMRHTPILKADDASVTTKISVRMDKDGRLIGDSDSDATGPFSIWLRQEANAIQGMGSEQAARQLLKGKGLVGTGGFEFPSPFDPGSHYRMQAHFELASHPQWVAGDSFFPPSGTSLATHPGEVLIGPIDRTDIRAGEPTPCFAGQEAEEIALELPPGKNVKELPTGTEFSNDLVRYKSVWTISGRTVTVRRELTSLASVPVCIGATRLLAAKALADIRTDYNKAIALVGN